VHSASTAVGENGVAAEKGGAPALFTTTCSLSICSRRLYAEVIRRTPLVESLQREFRVVVAGPTTLAALLNSLQMGFRTLAIQKQSTEVWNLLGEVKTEFGRFGSSMERVRKKLDQAADTVDEVSRRSKTIQKKLRNIEELPSEEPQALPGSNNSQGDAEED